MYAVGDGVVIKAAPDTNPGGYGLRVTIKLDDFDLPEGSTATASHKPKYATYAHCLDALVKVNDRVVRGQVLSLREKEYVEAGKALGYKNNRILFKHVLPNIMAPVIVISAANFASSILIEAGLSFLGIGTQPPIPSWGSMIKEHYAYIIMDKAYLAVVPGIAIMLLVFAFVVLGNALRDALDVKT